MESCSICFLGFTEKPEINLNNRCRFQKFLSCGHSLCFSCYLQLQQTKCPFCRAEFTYSFEDILLKNNKNIKRNNLLGDSTEQLNTNWQPPTTTPLANATTYDYNNQPFSRIKKLMNRKRRRNLSFDEVLDRRKKIKKKIVTHWIRKNGRLYKEIGYEI